MKNSVFQCQEILKTKPKKWLITGVAGFIGSNLLESLLKLNQVVVGLDNCSTGSKSNLLEIMNSVDVRQRKNFTFIQGDIVNLKTCREACKGIDYVLHHAAVSSVPISIDNPIVTNATNVTGFLNILTAARSEKVKKVIYASSSAVYGNASNSMKVEHYIGSPISPYGISKQIDELYAAMFKNLYNFQAIGLRYFNIFGPRQNAASGYGAVIPKWVSSMIRNEEIIIYGNGETSRDFCFVLDVIQSNILAACAEGDENHQIYNVGLGEKTTLLQLFKYLCQSLRRHGISYVKHPIYQDFRQGDIFFSIADIGKIRESLGYQPSYNVIDGINATIDWYILNHNKNNKCFDSVGGNLVLEGNDG